MTLSWNNIKERLALFYYKKEVKKHKHIHQFVNMDEVESVIVLFEIEKTINEAYVKLIEELEQKKKKVDVMCFLATKEAEDLPQDTRYNYFHRKEISWLKVPNQALVKRVNSKRYDLLILPDLNPHYSILFLSGVSNAKCRVGRYLPNTVPFLDLLINVSEKDGVRTYFTQLKHFLSIIRSDK